MVQLFGFLNRPKIRTTVLLETFYKGRLFALDLFETVDEAEDFAAMVNTHPDYRTTVTDVRID